MAAPIELVLAGAGQRGRDIFSRHVLESRGRLRLVSVADPVAARRDLVARDHGIPPEDRFEDWRALFAAPRRAAGAIIATPDSDHFAAAMAALETGHDVLLEKPMACRKDECEALVEAAARHGRVLQVCHVLRYTPVMRRVRQLLEEGGIGEVVTVEHRENVASWHMAHSFVRGNWRRAGEASPMILAKCCHDLDLISWLLGRRCARVSSFGSLTHFRPEHAPPGAPARCADGCPAAPSCPYDAIDFYVRLTPLKNELRRSGPLAVRAALAVLDRVPPLARRVTYTGWPRSAVTEQRGEAALLQALATGPYGRCVYRCDNDVVDHQVVAMEFEGGVTATLTMHGHSHEEGRTMRWDGTRGTLFARLGLFSSEVTVHRHRSGAARRWRFSHGPGQTHAGGDAAVVQAFAGALARRDVPPETSAAASLESHLLAFAAEEARVTGHVIHMDRFRSST